jgi:hypothetical protein
VSDATERPTTDRLGEIRARVAAATPGPWEFDSYCRILAPFEYLCDDEHYGNIVASVPAWGGDTARHPHDDNAELIAHSRDDLAYLLAELERLAAERDAARAWSARWKERAQAHRHGSDILLAACSAWERVSDEIRTAAGAPGGVGIVQAIRALAAENAALRAALREEWDSNHGEHCGMSSCEGRHPLCGWPLLPALAGEGDAADISHQTDRDADS